MKLLVQRERYLFLILLALNFAFIGCKKKSDNYTQTSISLQITEVNNGIKLSWDKVATSDFVRYEIYRSPSAIPDPTSKEPISSTLLLNSISNSDNHHFVDSLGVGNNYYRVVVVLKYRNLISPNVNVKSGISLNGSFSQAFISKSLGLLYVRLTSNTFSIIDYKNSTEVFNNVSAGAGTTYYVTKNENNQEVIYASSASNSITEYNASNLNLIKSHLISTPITSFNAVNGHAYINYNGFQDSLVTYNLANDTRIDAISSLSNDNSIFSESGNLLVTTSFSTSGLVSSYQIGTNKKPTLLQSVTDNFLLWNICRISPNGNYIIGTNGQLLTKDFVSLGFLENFGFSSFGDFVFSDDEKFIVAVATPNIQVYSLATLKMISSFSLSSSSFNQSKIFLDGSTLIIVENVFNQISGQSMISIRKKTLQF